MRERVIIVFIAIAIGLIVTTLIFFLYQQTRSLPDNTARTSNESQNTQGNSDEVLLVIDEPKDEALSDRRSIEVKGETEPDNIIVVSTNQEDIIADVTQDGKFSITIVMDAGGNKVVTRAIRPDGKSKEDVRIVTFNTEDF